MLLVEADDLPVVVFKQAIIDDDFALVRRAPVLVHVGLALVRPIRLREAVVHLALARAKHLLAMSVVDLL